MAQTIGSRICLISNSDIRYEGLLHGIDADANTVSLNNVRIFGTEGRRGGIEEVPASDQLFELIIFRGADIKDLNLFEKATMDPAIVSATPAANSHPVSRSVGGRAGNFYDQPTQPRQGGANAGSHNRRGGYRGGYGGNHNNNNNNNNNGGRYNNGHRGSYGRGGGYRRRQNEHTGRDFVPATGESKEEFKEEFDFAKSREEFEKKKNEFEKAKEDAKSHSKAYTKSSFFDNVSCDQKDKNQGRVDRAEMKKTDTETFGTEMIGGMSGFRRGRGGRGRYNRNY